MTTLTIPLTTLAVGVHTFPATGGAAVADADSLIVLTIDRTVANGFNAAPATTTALIYTYQSNDGGASWKWIAGALLTGGSYINPKLGTLETSSSVEVGLDPGTGRLARAVVTVSGAAVAVAGSLVTS